jgi:hypothetical protein
MEIKYRSWKLDQRIDFLYNRNMHMQVALNRSKWQRRGRTAPFRPLAIKLFKRWRDLGLLAAKDGQPCDFPASEGQPGILTTTFLSP